MSLISKKISTISKSGGQNIYYFQEYLQPVPKNMRRRMAIGLKIGTVSGQSPDFFLDEPFEKRPVMTIQDSDFGHDFGQVFGHDFVQARLADVT